MFDMIDVIHMSKISKHYLLEYQTLLETYEMQAPNVTSCFRVLDFSDDNSDDYTSDEWSVNESICKTPREVTNLSRTPRPNPSEKYSVSAGSKPLSIIIRRCNTPPLCSPLVQDTDKENSFSHESSTPALSNGLICDNVNVDVNSELMVTKVVQCCENISETQAQEDVLSDSSVENFDSSCSKRINVQENLVKYSDQKEVHYENAKSADLKEINPLFANTVLSCNTDEASKNPRSSSSVHDEVQKCVTNITENDTNNSSHFDSKSNENCVDSIEHPASLQDRTRKNLGVDVLEHQSHTEGAILQCNNENSTDKLSFKTFNEITSFPNQSLDIFELSHLSGTFSDDTRDLPRNKETDIESTLVEENSLFLGEGLDSNPFESVDGWRQLSCSPVLFSSDDESSSITDEVNKGIEAALAPSPQYNVILSCEKKKVGKLQELLMGAPPPPAVTTPLFSASEMLDIMKKSTDWVLVTSEQGSPQNAVSWAREAEATPWPRVKCLQYLGIHYNHGSVSEQYESLCQKLQSRCIASETASSVTVWSSFSLPISRKERRLLTSRHSTTGPPTGLSPGRRLSHLARRHRTFSSASFLNDNSRLHSSLPHVAPERRTILVETRKKETKKSRSSQKKKIANDQEKDVYTIKLNSSKRALFQSPTEDEKKSFVPSKFRPASATAVHARRALFTSEAQDLERKGSKAEASSCVSSSRKRPRSVSEEESHQPLLRRKLFNDAEAVVRPSPNEDHRQEISSTHKKKLLWAVAEALKKRGIGLSHPQFRACASALASTCRGHVQQVFALRQGSTSDRLLQLALQFVDKAVALHIKVSPQTNNSCSEVR